METANDLAERAAQLDARRREVGAEMLGLSRQVMPSADYRAAAIQGRQQELGTLAADLDAERATVHRQLRKLQRRERAMAQLQAAAAVRGEHAAIAAEAGPLAERLAALVQADAELHRTLIEATGATRLRQLTYDPEGDLRRLAWLAEMAAAVVAPAGPTDTEAKP